MTGVSVVRVLLGVVGAILLIGAVIVSLTGASVPIFVTIWMFASGTLLVIIALVEITRYRSQAAEGAHFQSGPGGGETVEPEPRFRRTEEVFVDPTTGRQMRVFADPNTGERRYVAEG